MKSHEIMQFIDNGTIITASKDEVLIGWGNRTFFSSAQSSDRPLFYFPDFFLTHSSPWFYHECWKKIPTSELMKSLNFGNQDEVSQRQWKNPYKKVFVEEFYQLKDLIDHGLLDKAVPYVFETTEGPLPQDQLGRSLQSALRFIHENSGYLYGTWEKDKGILGVTPELFVEMDVGEEETQIKTEACAGTCPKEISQTMKEDTKILLEHYLVVEGIQKALSPIAQVSCQPIEVRHYSNISHLLTGIEAVSQKKLTLDEVVALMHPTPALGAYPNPNGAEWLKNYQTRVPRDRFGAPVGYQDNHHIRSYVGIRNVQWDSSQTKIGAGCGIISQSTLDKEWKEIQWKITSIKKNLAL